MYTAFDLTPCTVYMVNKILLLLYVPICVWFFYFGPVRFDEAVLFQRIRPLGGIIKLVPGNVLAAIEDSND